MNTQDFCYWLQGYFELSGIDEGITKEQVAVIKEHLQLVFKKVTKEVVTPTQGNKGLKDLLDKYKQFQPTPLPEPYKVWCTVDNSVFTPREIKPTKAYTVTAKIDKPLEVICTAKQAEALGIATTPKPKEPDNVSWKAGGGIVSPPTSEDVIRC